MSSSVREIARKSGFSVAAVSKTLNSVDGTIRIGDETRKKILETARRLRYRPNNDIGLLVTPDLTYLDPLTARVLQGVQSEAQTRQSHVLCGLLSGGEIPYLVRESCVGGVILLHHAPAPITAHLGEKGLPFVVVNPNVDSSEDCVLCDDYKGMLSALEFQFERGCRRFAFVWEKNEHPSYEKRRRAFVDFGTKRKVEHTLFDSKPGASTAQDVRSLFKSSEPIGFIVYEEMMPLLFSLTGAAQRSSDQIVTVNDLISAKFLPPATSVRVPFLEMGRAAVRMIARKWEEGNKPLPSEVLQPELIRRP